MITYIKDKDNLRKAKRESKSLINKLINNFIKDNIDLKFNLIGYSANYMVTQNDNVIELDYNIIVPNECNIANIVDKVKEYLSKIINFEYNQENYVYIVINQNTNSLSQPYRIIINFLKEENNRWYKLIYDETYKFQEIENSDDLHNKINAIKSINGWWEAVKDQYLELKNKRLQENYCSFEYYVVVINYIYDTMKYVDLL